MLVFLLEYCHHHHHHHLLKVQLLILNMYVVNWQITYIIVFHSYFKYIKYYHSTFKLFIQCMVVKAVYHSPNANYLQDLTQQAKCPKINLSPQSICNICP